VLIHTLFSKQGLIVEEKENSRRKKEKGRRKRKKKEETHPDRPQQPHTTTIH
jgi:hypothetical protein